MGKVVLSGGEPPTTTEPDVVDPVRLPPLRKFAVSRWTADDVETIIVTGHALEPIGQSGIAVVEYKQVGESVLQTFSRIFNEWRDIVEMETNSQRIN